MLSTFKSTTDKIIQNIVTPLASIPPNLLTFLGIVPSIMFFLLVINHMYVGALLIYIFNAFDILDGAVAKRFHKVTAFGGFLDSTFDRIADFLIITSFAFAGIVNWEITSSLLLFSYLVSYTRSRAELASKGKQTFAIGLVERTERLVLLWIGLLFYVLWPGIILSNLNILEFVLVFVTFLSFITFCQRVWLAYKKL